MKFSLTERTDKGKVRKGNEDCAGYKHNRWVDGYLFCVADGMGGYGHGEVASKVAVDSLLKDFDLLRKCDLEPVQLVSYMVENVNSRLRYHKQNAGIARYGTTIALLIFLDGRMILGNVGDTRIYSHGENGLEQLSYDHNFAQELLLSGEISEEQAGKHPKRNVLTRALTGEDKISTPYVRMVSCVPGTNFVIASDGLYRMVNEAFIDSALAGGVPEAAADRLLAKVYENRASDNITFQIITPHP